MANSIFDPRDPDYCERCGGECVAPEHWDDDDDDDVCEMSPVTVDTDDRS